MLITPGAYIHELTRAHTCVKCLTNSFISMQIITTRPVTHAQARDGIQFKGGDYEGTKGLNVFIILVNMQQFR